MLTLEIKIIGPKSTTEPQAGLDTTTRAGPLAQLIVERIIKDGMDPDDQLLYNPTQWRNASHEPFANKTDWLKPLTKLSINGHEDTFSQRLGQECQPFDVDPPRKGLFKAEDVVIISNGRLVKYVNDHIMYKQNDSLSHFSDVQALARYLAYVLLSRASNLLYS